MVGQIDRMMLLRKGNTDYRINFDPVTTCPLLAGSSYGGVITGHFQRGPRYIKQTEDCSSPRLAFSIQMQISVARTKESFK